MTSAGSWLGPAVVPEQKASTGAGKKVGFGAAGAGLVLALVAALGQNGPEHEGRRYSAYLDGAGIPTACAGITGKAVVWGKTYTDAECTALETAYVQQMLANMGQCVHGEFEFHEIKAWGHFAYNVGTAAFCRSTAARRLNAGERTAACAEISKWVFSAGRDCRKAGSNCPGIPKRRAWERATCEGHL